MFVELTVYAKNQIQQAMAGNSLLTVFPFLFKYALVTPQSINVTPYLNNSSNIQCSVIVSGNPVTWFQYNLVVTPHNVLPTQFRVTTTEDCPQNIKTFFICSDSGLLSAAGTIEISTKRLSFDMFIKHLIGGEKTSLATVVNYDDPPDFTPYTVEETYKPYVSTDRLFVEMNVIELPLTSFPPNPPKPVSPICDFTNL